MATESAAVIVLTTLIVGAAGYATYTVVQTKQGNKTQIEATRVNEELETVKIVVVQDAREMQTYLNSHNVQWNGETPSYRLLTDPKTCVAYILLGELTNELTSREAERCQILIDRAKTQRGE